MPSVESDDQWPLCSVTPMKHEWNPFESTSSEASDNSEQEEVEDEDDVSSTAPSSSSSQVYERLVRVDDLFGGDLGYLVIDSLMEHVLYSQEDKTWEFNTQNGLDWELHGGQMMHFVYLAEKVLMEWRRLHPTLHLVYIKDWMPSYTKNAGMKGLYLIARQILFEHLVHLRVMEQVWLFEGDWSTNSDFLVHMEIEKPAFICVPCTDEDFAIWNLSSHDSSVVFGLSATKSSLIGQQLLLKGYSINCDSLKVECFASNAEKLLVVGKRDKAQFFQECLDDAFVALGIPPNIHITKAVERTVSTQNDLRVAHLRETQVSFYFPELNMVLNEMYKAMYFKWSARVDMKYAEVLDLFDGKLCHYYLREILSENADQSNEPELSQVPSRVLHRKYHFPESPQVTRINHTLINNEKLQIPIETWEQKEKTKAPLFKNDFHWHSNRKLEEFDRNHASLLSWAKKLPQKRTHVRTFPKISKENYAKLDRELTTRYIQPDEFFEKRIEFVASKRKENFEYIEIACLINEDIDRLEYSRSIGNTNCNDSLQQAYSSILKCFENTFIQLTKDSKKITPKNITSDQKEYIWKVVCWSRFIMSFIELKKGFLAATQRETVEQRVKKELLRIQMRHEAGGKGENVVNVNQLFLALSIRIPSPHPPLEEFMNKKRDMLLDVDNKISLAKTRNQQNLERLRSLLIRKKIISELRFIPDEWQLELMNYIDENCSVLVSAPTSSGKTFISSYLIQKMLAHSDESLVVFIVPTNALVNQVFLDLYTSIDKSKTVIGMYTKYQRVNVQTCQILISTPNMFEILLMSQSEDGDKMRQRIQYLILDEIHNMNNEGGESWEHIMMLSNCPILALSATLGNPDSLLQWIKTIRANQRVEKVVCEHRIVPLSYYYFDTQRLLHVHPLAALNPYQIVQQEIERIKTLGINECLEFLSVAEKEFSDKDNPFNAYCDCSAFGDRPLEYIERSRILNFQSEVTELLKKCSLDGNYSDSMLNIFKTLREPLSSSIRAVDESSENDDNYFFHQLIPLLLHMKAQNLLPAICFIFDKRMINLATQMLCNSTEVLECLSLWSSPAKALQSKLEIEKSIKNLESELGEGEIPSFAIDALRLGIGMHYASLNSLYQEEVERLLKANALPLVFATTTLALGLNMPAKSVIIGIESTYMNQVTFNQCSGRAGRRGLEIFGNVIFLDVKLPRIFRYLNAEVPSIRGSHSISPAFLMRLLIIYNELKQKMKSTRNPFTASKKIVTLTNQIVTHVITPLLSMMDEGKEQMTNQIKYLFRFHIEFLYRIGMINTDGEPLLYSGVVTHLHYLEPYNLLFAYFMNRGLFYGLEAKEILLVLCYLFSRQKTRLYKVPTMPAPPARFIEAAEEYNRTVLNIYSDDVEASTGDNTSTEKLPLSSIAVNYGFEPSSTSQFAKLSGNKPRSYHNFSHFTSTVAHSVISNPSMLPYASFYEPDMSNYIIDCFEGKDAASVIKEYHYLNHKEFSKHIVEFYERVKVVYFGLVNQNIIDKWDPVAQHLHKIFRTLKKYSDYSETDLTELQIIEDKYSQMSIARVIGLIDYQEDSEEEDELVEEEADQSESMTEPEQYITDEVKEKAREVLQTALLNLDKILGSTKMPFKHKSQFIAQIMGLTESTAMFATGRSTKNNSILPRNETEDTTDTVRDTNAKILMDSAPEIEKNLEESIESFSEDTDETEESMVNSEALELISRQTLQSDMQQLDQVLVSEDTTTVAKIQLIHRINTLSIYLNEPYDMLPKLLELINQNLFNTHKLRVDIVSVITSILLLDKEFTKSYQVLQTNLKDHKAIYTLLFYRQ